MDLDFQKIFERVTVPLSIAEPNYPNRLVYVNQAYAELTGYNTEEMIGKSPGELLKNQPYTKQREIIRERLNAFQAVDVLIRNTRKDGTEFWNGLHIHPVIENGICIYWVAIAKDVSEFVNEINIGLEAIISTVKDSFQQMSQGIESV